MQGCRAMNFSLWLSCRAIFPVFRQRAHPSTIHGRPHGSKWSQTVVTGGKHDPSIRDIDPFIREIGDL